MEISRITLRAYCLNRLSNRHRIGLLFLLFWCLWPSYSTAQWQFTQSKQLTSEYDMFRHSSVYLPDGRYAVSGNLIDTIKLDPYTTLIPSANPAIYVALFSEKDSVLWYQIIKHQSTTSKLSVTTPIQLLNNNQIVIAGSFTGSLQFPNGSSKSAGTLADAFWGRFTLDGKCKAVGTYTDGILSALACSSMGKIALAGRASNNGNNAFIGVFDSSGVLPSKQNYLFKGTSQNRDIVNALCFGPDGSLYYGGKANGDSIGIGNLPQFVDAPNDINRYNLFFGKIDATGAPSWIKGGTPIPGSRPYQFNIGDLYYDKDLNRVWYSGMFEGANYSIDSFKLATTSTVNTDARKPIVFCIDTMGKLLWHHSLGLNSENQRGEIFTLTKTENGIWLSADIEHYLFSDLVLGSTTFKWGEKAFLMIRLDSLGKILQSFGTNPKAKKSVNNVNSATFHPSYGFKISLVNTLHDTLELPKISIRKGTYLLSANLCDLSVGFNSFSREICQNHAPITIVPTKKGGTFFGAHINNAGIINPADVGKGISLFGYELQDEKGCIAEAVDSVLVHEITPVSIINLDSVFCPKDTIIILKSDVSGGVFTGKGVDQSNFNPKNAGTGQHLIYYTYSNAKSCVSKDSVTVRIKSQNECENTNVLRTLTNNAVILFPNPLKDEELHIRATEPIKLIRIYASTGVLLSETQTNVTQVQIPTKEFPKGMLWIESRLESGEVFREWVVYD